MVVSEGLGEAALFVEDSIVCLLMILMEEKKTQKNKHRWCDSLKPVELDKELNIKKKLKVEDVELLMISY